jgi:hypothetical protein
VTIDEAIERIERAAKAAYCDAIYRCAATDAVVEEVRLIRIDEDLQRLKVGSAAQTLGMPALMFASVTVADLCALQRVLKNTDDPGDFTVASAFVAKCEELLGVAQ